MLNPIMPPDNNPEKDPLAHDLDTASDQGPEPSPDKPIDDPPVETPVNYVYKLNPKEEVTPRNMTEIADDLGVSLRVARKYIKSIAHKIGERIGQLFSRRQVTIIYENFGYPKRFLLF